MSRIPVKRWMGIPMTFLYIVGIFAMALDYKPTWVLNTTVALSVGIIFWHLGLVLHDHRGDNRQNALIHRSPKL